MYGTTGYLVPKTGMEDKLAAFIEDFSHTQGIVSICLYKVDSDKNDFIESVLWKDKNAHDTTASHPDFPKAYQNLLELLADEPVWYSGEMRFITPGK